MVEKEKSAKLDGCCVWYLKDGNVDTEQCFENGEYKRPIITVKHKTECMEWCM